MALRCPAKNPIVSSELDLSPTRCWSWRAKGKALLNPNLAAKLPLLARKGPSACGLRTAPIRTQWVGRQLMNVRHLVAVPSEHRHLRMALADPYIHRAESALLFTPSPLLLLSTTNYTTTTTFRMQDASSTGGSSTPFGSLFLAVFNVRSTCGALERRSLSLRPIVLTVSHSTVYS